MTARARDRWVAFWLALLLGVVYLLDNLHLPYLRWLNFDVIWPLLLILGGIALLVRRAKGE